MLTWFHTSMNAPPPASLKFMTASKQFSAATTYVVSTGNLLPCCSFLTKYLMVQLTTFHRFPQLKGLKGTSKDHQIQSPC